MEVVPDYEDRGMKKWRPFYSSPELCLSLNSVMNEFKQPYPAPGKSVMSTISGASLGGLVLVKKRKSPL